LQSAGGRENLAGYAARRGFSGATMTGLTTHVLDTAHGRPAAGVLLRLLRDGDVLTETRTNADGRCDSPLLTAESVKVGRYRLEFEVGGYFRSLGVVLPDPAFLETVMLDFGIADPAVHYHVPLLVSPFGYSTYRGS
jgi:5-hydroxyisourate hydrolase